MVEASRLVNMIKIFIWEVTFIFGDIKGFEKLGVTDSGCEKRRDVQKFKHVVGHAGVAVVSFDREFLPGFVYFQMSSQVRFYQIRVVF